jgi:hypothetical protein
MPADKRQNRKIHKKEGSPINFDFWEIPELLQQFFI